MMLIATKINARGLYIGFSGISIGGVYFKLQVELLLHRRQPGITEEQVMHRPIS